MTSFDALLQRCQAQSGRMLADRIRLDVPMSVGPHSAVFVGTTVEGDLRSVELAHGAIRPTDLGTQYMLRIARQWDSLRVPATLQLFDAAIDEEGFPFVCRALPEGENIQRQALTTGGSLPIRDVLWVMDNVLALLEQGHVRGLAHGDLRPQHIWLSQERQVAVTGMGIAELVRHCHENPMRRPDALRYLAPELQELRNAPTPSSDIYALGVIGKELLEAEARNPRQGTHVSEVALLLEGIMPACHASAEARFPDARAFRLALRQLTARLRGGGPTQARPARTAAPSGATPAARPSGRSNPPDAARPGGMPATSSAPSKLTPTPTGPTPAPAQPAAVASSRGQSTPTGDPQRPHALEPGHSSHLPGTDKRQREAPPAPTDSGPPAVSPEGASGSQPLAGGASRVQAPHPVIPDPPTAASGLAAASLIPPPNSAQVQERKSPGAAMEPPRAPPPPRGRDSLVPSPGTELVALPLEEAQQQRALKAFKLMGNALMAQKQYGREHPESHRRVQTCAEEFVNLARSSDGGVTFQVTPHGFRAGDVTYWQPEAPFDRIPYQLFSDGVRTLAFTTTLDAAQASQLVNLVSIDPSKELEGEDDLVILLWEADFSDIRYGVVDSLSEGDQRSRERFLGAVQEIVHSARAWSSERLEQCWKLSRAGTEHKTTAPVRLDAVAQGHQLLQLLEQAERYDERDAERMESLRARAASQSLQDAATEALQVPRERLVEIACDMADTGDVLLERFMWITVLSYLHASHHGDPNRILDTVRSAASNLTREHPEMALAFVVSMARAVKQVEQEHRGEQLARTLLQKASSPELMRAVLQSAAQGALEQHARLHTQLRDLFAFADGQHLEVVFAYLPQLAPTLQNALLPFLQREGAQKTELFSAQFPTASLELSLTLIDVLAKIEGSAARDAIASASASPHVLVRIQALGHIEGASSEPLRKEVGKLLEDSDEEVRLATLETMSRHRILAAGSFLVLQILSPRFQKFSLAYRRQALRTVAAVAPWRIEKLCMELASSSSMLEKESSVQTRLLAYELLTEIGSATETLDFLQKETGKRLQRREVKDAVGQARDAVLERLQAKGKRP